MTIQSITDAAAVMGNSFQTSWAFLTKRFFILKQLHPDHFVKLSLITLGNYNLITEALVMLQLSYFIFRIMNKKLKRKNKSFSYVDHYAPIGRNQISLTTVIVRQPNSAYKEYDTADRFAA